MKSHCSLFTCTYGVKTRTSSLYPCSLACVHCWLCPHQPWQDYPFMKTRNPARPYFNLGHTSPLEYARFILSNRDPCIISGVTLDVGLLGLGWGVLLTPCRQHDELRPGGCEPQATSWLLLLAPGHGPQRRVWDPCVLLCDNEGSSSLILQLKFISLQEWREWWGLWRVEKSYSGSF